MARIINKALATAATAAAVPPIVFAMTIAFVVLVFKDILLVTQMTGEAVAGFYTVISSGDLWEHKRTIA